MKPILLFLLATVLSCELYAQKPDVSLSNNDKIYTSAVEVMPKYKGGEDGLNFRLEHIRYLFADRVKNIEGEILVAFVIEKDGSISNIKMLKGLTEGQDQEVVRVIKNLRKWKPGMQDGKPVRVQLVIPIDFKIIRA
jgi:protein TonB